MDQQSCLCEANFINVLKTKLAGCGGEDSEGAATSCWCTKMINE
jgi:hypothetical protein